MIKLVLSAIAFAATDCLDPLSISVQIYLLTTKRALLNSLGFILGIFAATLFCGVIITLGPVKELDSIMAHPNAPYFIFQALVGLGLTYGSYHYWYHFSHRKESHPIKMKVNPITCFVLGGTFTVTDLPTNIPLLALADELARSQADLTAITASSLAYSMMRTAPLFLIVSLYAINQERAREVISAVEEKLIKWGHLVVAATISILGIALTIDSVVFFALGKPLFVP
ncbi:hypothetical protein GC174_06870 [bacterium]|nr:hypothetical protein [bacterium]